MVKQRGDCWGRGTKGGQQSLGQEGIREGFLEEVTPASGE